MSNNKKVTYKSSFTSKIINKKNLSKENLIKENDFNKFFKPIIDMELIETEEISIVKDELLTLGFFKVANGRSSWCQAMIELDSITFNETLPKLQKKYPEQLIEVVSDSGKISYESVLNQIIDKSSDDTIDDFIESKCKPPIKSDSVYKNLKNQLGGFKKLIGHRGKISWSDINNETIYNA